MITAKYGSKKFEVSSNKIYTPNGISISEELDIEETEVSGKKPTVKVKGIKLQGLSCDVKLDARFVDVVTELRFWKNTLLAKKSNMFSLGTYTIGKFFLTKLDVKDILINKNGEYISAVISLAFSEDGEYANSDKINFDSPGKAKAVKDSATSKLTLGKGSVIKPKSGVRWYYTAEDAIKKSGRSGKAYQKNMTVTYTYSKNGKIVCVNPQGLGWLRVEDVAVISSGNATSSTTSTVAKKVYMQHIGKLKKELIVGSYNFMISNTETINGKKYYSSGGRYYPIEYAKSRKIDGGRTNAYSFPVGTPIYRK